MCSVQIQDSLGECFSGKLQGENSLSLNVFKHSGSPDELFLLEKRKAGRRPGQKTGGDAQNSVCV